MRGRNKPSKTKKQKLELEQSISHMRVRSGNEPGGKVNTIKKNTDSYFEKKLRH